MFDVKWFEAKKRIRRIVKGWSKTSKILRDEFPELKTKLPTLWTNFLSRAVVAI